MDSHRHLITHLNEFSLLLGENLSFCRCATTSLFLNLCGIGKGKEWGQKGNNVDASTGWVIPTN